MDGKHFDCTCDGEGMLWSDELDWYVCNECGGYVTDEEISNFYNEPVPPVDDDEPEPGMDGFPRQWVEQWEDDQFIYGAQTWWDGTQWQQTVEVLQDKRSTPAGRDALEAVE